jgi:hypothetical protein
VSGNVVFILTIVSAAVDFWITQNATGKLLVGLKWRVHITESGEDEWVYNSYSQEVNLNRVDKYTFWGGLVGWNAVWIVLLGANILTFNMFWGLCCGICFALGYTNLRGFWRCNKDYQQKLKNYIQSQGT